MANYDSNKQAHELVIVTETITEDSLFLCQDAIGNPLGVATPASIIKTGSIDDIQDGTEYKKISLITKTGYDEHLVDVTNPHYVTKDQIGLSNVDNTADLDKPISTDVGSALNILTIQTNRITPIENELDSHIGNISNPHTVSKDQVGLSNVDNTSDLNKPISTATQSALDTKANGTGTAYGSNTGDQIIPTTLPASDVYAWAKLPEPPDATIQFYDYDNRNDARAFEPLSENVIISIESLGVFSWNEGSTELDDDESCFLTANGAWLLQAAHWDLIDAWHADEFDINAKEVIRLESEINSLESELSTSNSYIGNLIKLVDNENNILKASFTNTVTSVAADSLITLNVTVTGAVVGDTVIITPSGTSPFGSDIGDVYGFVSVIDNVAVTFIGSDTNISYFPAGTWQIYVIKDILDINPNHIKTTFSNTVGAVSPLQRWTVKVSVPGASVNDTVTLTRSGLGGGNRDGDVYGFVSATDEVTVVYTGRVIDQGSFSTGSWPICIIQNKFKELNNIEILFRSTITVVSSNLWVKEKVSVPGASVNDTVIITRNGLPVSMIEGDVYGFVSATDEVTVVYTGRDNQASYFAAGIWTICVIK